jgi:hypothetical protein
MIPFFCEHLSQTFLLQTLHAPLWPAHATEPHNSHFMLCLAQNVELQM